MTGATGELGALLLPWLQADPEVKEILAIGGAEQPQGDKVQFHALDLSQHETEAPLTELLSAGPIDALYHLALPVGPGLNAQLAHELDVVGTLNVLGAAAAAGVKRLVVPSFTALYGAKPKNPVLLDEDAPLFGCPQSRFVSDKVELEHQIKRFREHQPQCHVIVLRMAPIVGPGINNPISRLLSGAIVPTLWGFDPLCQVLHPEDAARALYLALKTRASGVFNIVGQGVMALSGVVREAGARPLPLPPILARATLRALHAVGVPALPMSLLDYIHYSCIADGARARNALGFTPRHHVAQAAASLRRS